MSWSKDAQRPDGPELLYTSSARDVDVLACDLWCVIYRMLQRKTYSLNADALFQACLGSDDAADTFEDWVGTAVSWVAEDQDDLVNEEPVKEGHRPGLRPLHTADGIHYAHPAYELPMSKTDPVDLYWRDPMTDEIEVL